MSEFIALDAETFHFGPPCKYGHGFDTGKTLRYNANNRCVACERDVQAGVKRQEKSRAERFWLRVNKNGPIAPNLGTPCWLWTGGTNDLGYGRCSVDNQHWLTHRYAWYLEHGEFDLSLAICHGCDNPPCVRPDHLFSGTRADNNKDMFDKGRAAIVSLPGVKHPQARLTEESVREIRAKYATGNYAQTVLAKEYGVKQAQISSIVRGESWRHLL